MEAPQSQMLEDSGLLKNYWYVLARDFELHPRNPLRRVLFEIPIVLWRDSHNNPVAMIDRCSHRNAPLSQGIICNNSIRCPYHGWTYDLDGNCIEVPSEGERSFTSKSRGIRTFPTLEKYGLVYAWIGDGPPDKEPFPMPYWKQAGWGSYYMYTEFDNNVTNLVENFMDVPHTVFVHKSWFRKQKEIQIGMEIERTEDSVLVTYDQPDDSIGFSGWALNPKKLPLTHTDRFYLPNVTRVDYVFGADERAFVITSTCTPISEYKSAVYTLISYKFGLLNPLMRIILPPYTRKVIDQDVWIMKLQGENLKTFGGSNFCSTPADTLHVFIESLRDWATNGGKDDKPEPRKVNQEFWI